MNKATFPIEFNNEIDDVKKSENENYLLAVKRLSKSADRFFRLAGMFFQSGYACCKPPLVENFMPVAFCAAAKRVNPSSR